MAAFAVLCFACAAYASLPFEAGGPVQRSVSDAIVGFIPVTPALSALSLDPTTVGGGASTTAQVTISSPAPQGGMLVNLSSSKSTAQVQSSVKIPEGHASATFAVSTTAVTAATTVTITATLGNVTQSATLNLNPIGLSALSVHPSTVKDGSSSTGVVELNGPAGSGGLVVSIASNNTAVTVPRTVTIAAGHSSATFAITTTAVTVQTTVTLTATLGAASQTATIVLKAKAASTP